MTSRAEAGIQKSFHRYIAILFAIIFVTLCLLEVSQTDMHSEASPIRWATYLVLSVWAIYLVQLPDADAKPLVVTTIVFFGVLSMIEQLLDVQVSAFDFATTFGLIMMIGVLVGTLSAGSRLVWAGGVAVSLAVWSVAMGVLREEPVGTIGVRATIAIAGVVFTTALVSKLYDQLASAIDRYQRSSRLQDAIARCSEALLVQTDAFAVYEAVKALLEATDADYAYVDAAKAIDGELGWEVIADASRRSSDYGTAWKTGKYSSVPTFRDALLSGRSIAVHTKDMTGPERTAQEGDGILSEVAVPILVAGEFRGSIGFVSYTDDRDWSDSEIQTLWRAAHMIGAYWQRQDDAAQLRESNASKERLLASVSHEIRTPLTAIVGLSEEIISSRTALGDEELDELNGIIAVQSRELAELVEDLLVASRADGGTLSIKPDVMDLRLQAEGVLSAIKESHPSTKTIVVHGDDVLAWADPLRVRQIMRNLLTNAIKYGGDKIVVGVRAAGDTAQLVVADDGGGVAVDESDLIFERYYRSDRSPTQPGSVGIGLAVSRQLADLMGGRLEYVHGDPPRFELSLPLISSDVLDSEESITVGVG